MVLATGASHSVRELCDTAFSRVGLDYRDYVEEEAGLVRADDFDRLGDPSKAARVLDWRPAVGFGDLVAMMVEADMNLVRRTLR